jgi:hypothetical protein
VVEPVRQTGATGEEAELAYQEQFAWWQHHVHMVLIRNQLTEGEAKAFAVNTPRAYGGRSVGALFYRTMKPTLNPDAVAYVDAALAEQSQRERQ